jgi:glycosyltransferase 2 family protein
MKSKLDFVWPLIGLAAVAFSIYLLSNELKDVHIADVWRAITDRGWTSFGLCVLSTLVAYAALAWYDRIALMHVGKVLSWPVVSVVSFVAYAVGHNIGVSVLSSGVVRYRAYSRMGLNTGEVAIVTAFCAFTFAYGAVLLGGIVLLFEPDLISRLFHLPTEAPIALGLALLACVGLYQLGAILHFRPLIIRQFVIEYPRPGIAFRQLFAAPVEIIGAAGIIYFALPELDNPGFFVVLGIFLASFCAGLLSNAPGGIGVFEAVFLLALPEVAKADVLGALVMFRLLYLLVPLAMSCVVILAFERRSLGAVFRALLGRRAINPPIPTAAIVREQIEVTRPETRSDAGT